MSSSTHPAGRGHEREVDDEVKERLLHYHITEVERMMAEGSDRASLTLLRPPLHTSSSSASRPMTSGALLARTPQRSDIAPVIDQVTLQDLATNIHQQNELLQRLLAQSAQPRSAQADAGQGSMSASSQGLHAEAGVRSSESAVVSATPHANQVLSGPAGAPLTPLPAHAHEPATVSSSASSSSSARGSAYGVDGGSEDAQEEVVEEEEAEPFTLDQLHDKLVAFFASGHTVFHKDAVVPSEKLRARFEKYVGHGESVGPALFRQLVAWVSKEQGLGLRFGKSSNWLWRGAVTSQRYVSGVDLTENRGQTSGDGGGGNGGAKRESQRGQKKRTKARHSNAVISERQAFLNDHCQGFSPVSSRLRAKGDASCSFSSSSSSSSSSSLSSPSSRASSSSSSSPPLVSYVASYSSGADTSSSSASSSSFPSPSVSSISQRHSTRSPKPQRSYTPSDPAFYRRAQEADAKHRATLERRRKYRHPSTHTRTASHTGSHSNRTARKRHIGRVRHRIIRQGYSQMQLQAKGEEFFQPPHVTFGAYERTYVSLGKLRTAFGDFSGIYCGNKFRGLLVWLIEQRGKKMEVAEERTTKLYRGEKKQSFWVVGVDLPEDRGVDSASVLHDSQENRREGRSRRKAVGERAHERRAEANVARFGQQAPQHHGRQHAMEMDAMEMDEDNVKTEKTANAHGSESDRVDAAREDRRGTAHARKKRKRSCEQAGEEEQSEAEIAAKHKRKATRDASSESEKETSDSSTESERGSDGDRETEGSEWSFGDE